MTGARVEGYLIDTSVLSAFAPGRPTPSAEVVTWLQEREARLFIPCIAVAELEQGIRKLRRNGAAAKAARLSTWMDGLIDEYADRVLPLDSGASRAAGQIADKAVAAGKHPGFPDVAIAALARNRRLMVLTRNTRHFAALDVPHADPFERLPDSP